MKIYASWCQGLCSNGEALGILKTSGIVSGVQTSSDIGPDELRMYHDAGLEISLHNPGIHLTLNLADQRTVHNLRYNDTLRAAVQVADDPLIGLHCGYSNTRVTKGEIGVAAHGTAITDGGVLGRIFIQNLRAAQDALNGYSPGRRLIIENISQYWIDGDGPCVRSPEWEHIDDPHFMMHVASQSGAGVLLDVPHGLRTGNWLEVEKRDSSGRAGFMRQLLECVRGHVYQIHVNRLSDAYEDVHRPLVRGDRLSDEVMEWASIAAGENPVASIIPEITTYGDPLSHARVCVGQAELIMRTIGR